jgi:hypothetical protein
LKDVWKHSASSIRSIFFTSACTRALAVAVRAMVGVFGNCCLRRPSAI